MRKIKYAVMFNVIATQTLTHKMTKLHTLGINDLTFKCLVHFFFFFPLLTMNREGNHPDDYSKITYKKLLQEVCRFANVLKSHGVQRGDTVSIYMPMVLELPIAMLACARIGAIHSIVVITLNISLCLLGCT